MRIQVAVNDGAPVRASLNGKGWLSMHLNLTSDEANSSSGSLFLQAIDCTDEPNSVNSIWEVGDLFAGGKAEIRVLDDGDADPPTKLERSEGQPTNLFSNVDLARQLLAAIKECDWQLMQILDRGRGAEPEAEFKKIARAVGGILVDMDRNLIQPTLRRHPELLADAREMKLTE